MKFIAFAVSALLAFSSSSLAGELIVHSHDPVKLIERATTCQIELRGEILPGDAAKLEQFLEVNAEKLSGIPFWSQGGDGYDICLEGPGGSYAEALQIVDVLSKRKVGTRVRKNDKCESACAVAFMGGILFVDGDSPLRVLEPGAKLGFHAPSIELPGAANIPVAMVEVAYKAALRDISGIVDRLGVNSEWGTEPRMSGSLLSKMLSTPPDSMFYPTTINEAGIWDINLHYSESDSVNFSEANMLQACKNYGSWMNDSESFGTGDPMYTPMYNIRQVNDEMAFSGERVIEIQMMSVFDTYCRFFYLDGLKRIGPGDVRVSVRSEETSKEETFYTNVWQFLNPTMTLADLGERGQ